MRSYFFCNYYLSQIQQGIQSLHCITDMIYKYQNVSSIKPKIIEDWAVNHKTAILLNGGNQASLEELYTFFNSPVNPYPYGKFHEDQQSMNNCLTSVGIILPPSIYEGSALLRDRRNSARQVIGQGDLDIPLYTLVDQYGKDLQDEPFEYIGWEIELMTKMNEYRLA